MNRPSLAALLSLPLLFTAGFRFLLFGATVPPGSIGAVQPAPGFIGGQASSGTLAAGENQIPMGYAMVVQFTSGATATIQGVYESGKTTNSHAMINAGDTYTFRRPTDGSGFRSVKGSAADSDVLWDVVPDGQYPFFQAG